MEIKKTVLLYILDSTSRICDVSEQETILINSELSLILLFEHKFTHQSSNGSGSLVSKQYASYAVRSLIDNALEVTWCACLVRLTCAPLRKESAVPGVAIPAWVRTFVQPLPSSNLRGSPRKNTNKYILMYAKHGLHSTVCGHNTRAHWVSLIIHCNISIPFMRTFFIYIEKVARLGIHQIYYEHHHVSCACLAHVAHMTKCQIGTMWNEWG